VRLFFADNLSKIVNSLQEAELKSQFNDLVTSLKNDKNLDIQEATKREIKIISHIRNNNEKLEEFDLQDEVKMKRESNIYSELESLKEKESDSRNDKNKKMLKLKKKS